MTVATAPARPRRRTAFTLAALVIAVGLLAEVALVIFRFAVLPDHQASSAVTGYLEALAGPDPHDVLPALAPETVAALPPDSAGDDHPAALLQIVSAYYIAPTDVVVGTVAIDGARATVDVSFAAGPGEERYDATVRLRRDDGLAGSVLSRWLVVDAMGTVDLDAVAPGIALECVERDGFMAACLTLDRLRVADAAGEPTRRPIVFPGRHRIEILQLDPLTGWQVQRVDVVVVPGGTGEVVSR